MKKIIAAALAAGVLLFSGCTGGNGTVTGQDNLTGFNGNPGGSTNTTQKAANTALFQPLAGILPYPYDVYFSGSTDGTLNIQPANPLIPAQAAVNALDGFSTTAPIRERFNGPIDAASLATSGAVVVVHINTNNLTKAPVSPLQGGVFVPLAGCVKGAACAGADYMVAPATDDPTILEITPLKPLAASTCVPTPPQTASPCAAANGGNGEGYMVLLTRAITVGGVPTVADKDYASFQAALASGGPTCPSITNASLNAICQLTGAHLAFAQALGINPANVTVSFSFSAESTLDTLAAAASLATPQLIKVNQLRAPNGTPLTTASFQGLGLADVYVGVVTLPYYLSKTSPDIEYWHASAAMAPDKTSTFTTRFNPYPVATQTLQVPVLMSVPNINSGTVKPAGGWPIVVFEHGITADRTNLFGIADSLAHGGFVGIVIDLPLHGLTHPFNPVDPTTILYASNANPYYAVLGLPASGSIERTFDLTTLSNGMAIDPSGSHFLGAVASPLTFRDLMRESSVDLVTLAESVGSITLSAPATAPYIDYTKVHFMGHSMGAIIGTGFLAVMPPAAVLSATLANPGGQFIYLGVESPTFGPPTIAAIQKASGGLLTPGTTIFAQYTRDLQSVIDSGDPWNFIALASLRHPIHMIEVIGPPPDSVVPNDSTDRLIGAGGFTQASPPGVAGTAPLHKVVKFTAGNHSSFLLPTASSAATVEMQTEAVSFAVTNGMALPVTPGAPVQ
jgi:pimeloyl-ACP methyl ester carboxylesterase